MENKESINQTESSQTIEQEKTLEYKRKIVELFEIGEKSEDIYAWHGTSIEAILYLAKHGRLPISDLNESALYYAPEESLRIEAKEHASMYANKLAEEYYVLNKLPFKIKDYKLFSGIFDHENYDTECKEFVEDDLKKFIKKEIIPNNFDVELFRLFVAEAPKKCKGALISLSKSITQDYEEHMGDDMEFEDMCVQTKDGLPLQYMTGIVPLGQYEREEFEKMKKEVI
ncbi:hypothetical protein D4R87_02350 [bacterium]|nr:MAG: hypothetical protein D4R87_02350 [bacterium]